MLARDLINKSIPYLKNSDTGDKALDIMETYKISHLPVVDEKENFLGVISENDIYFFNLEKKVIEKSKVILKNFSVSPADHIFKVIRSFDKLKTTVIPVVEKEKYKGLISPLSVIKYLSVKPPIRQKGFAIIIKAGKKDYSPSKISSIIEINKSKLLVLFYDEKEDSSEIFLKIESSDIESVIDGLEKNGFQTILLEQNTEKLDELYKERLDYFKKFVEI